MIESVEVVIKQSGHVDRVVRLSEGATRLGRAEDNEVVLSDVGVSRRHAQVYVSRQEVTVEDLGSGNGTFYNGYRVQSQPIQDGDEIVIDPFILQFRIRAGAVRGSSRAAPAPAGGDRQSAFGQARLEVGGSSFPITGRGLSIGRSEDRDVVINDPAASRHHCQVSAQGGEYTLRDMGSANGVFVNSDRVKEVALADGDVIRIGNTEIRFLRSDRAAEPRAGAAPLPMARAPEPRMQREPTIASTTARPPPAPLAETRGMTAARGRVVPWVLGGALLLAVTMAGLVAVLAVVLFATRSGGGGVATQSNAHPPRWSLTLPEGLQAEEVPTLFQAGQDKMRDRDNRGALQDFFRVLEADPGYPYVDKFAFAAGENYVLEVLQKEFSQRAEERARADADRARLLRELANGNRTAQLRAEKTLKRMYADDPDVREKLSLTSSPAAEKARKLMDDGAEALKNGEYDRATDLLQEVVATSKDPQIRVQALASLKLCQKEVARASRPKWVEAVEAEAGGDGEKAKTLFQEIKEEHPSNPSPRLHLERLR